MNGNLGSSSRGRPRELKYTSDWVTSYSVGNFVILATNMVTFKRVSNLASICNIHPETAMAVSVLRNGSRQLEGHDKMRGEMVLQ